ncbi:hypothetical protein BDFB_009306 [Asbolus verrucosus]|uniref:Uncharacterized protein n=1 Tax=Asbolus verrucosus TaxID=1661398 RepID=A0A482VSZ1_ASBVE|nr:hypothetical protein BDFB_009306 [Asbolus verrucosus]
MRRLLNYFAQERKWPPLSWECRLASLSFVETPSVPRALLQDDG